MMLDYPELTCFVSWTIGAKGVVGDVPTDYPATMRNASFGAVIPTTATDPVVAQVLPLIKKAHITYQTKASLVLDKRIRKMDAALLMKQTNFVQVAIDQSLLSNDVRTHWIKMDKMGIIKNGALVDSVAKMAAEYNMFANIESNLM